METIDNVIEYLRNRECATHRSRIKENLEWLYPVEVA